MAKLESRFGSFLLVIPESEDESKLIDATLGSAIPSDVRGEVTLADGYGQHYVLLHSARPLLAERGA